MFTVLHRYLLLAIYCMIVSVLFFSLYIFILFFSEVNLCQFCSICVLVYWLQYYVWSWYFSDFSSAHIIRKLRYNRHVNILSLSYHVLEVSVLWADQWSVQEPVSPWLAKEWSSEGHWSVLSVFSPLSAPILVCWIIIIIKMGIKAMTWTNKSYRTGNVVLCVFKMSNIFGTIQTVVWWWKRAKESSDWNRWCRTFFMVSTCATQCEIPEWEFWSSAKFG